MNAAVLMHVLLYSAIVNYAVLIVWFLALIVAHDTLYRLHVTWFRLSPEAFDMLHYGGMSVYKIGILLLNVAPLVALYFSVR
jgi:hypothetical protein